MGIIAWIVLGLFAGTIARALIPGRTEPGGCIGTTAVGVLGALLVLTLYLFVSAAIFLIGAELDELLRKETDGRGVALTDVFAAVVRR